MPEETEYDVELSIGGLFTAGFNNPGALCNALLYTRDNPLEEEEEYEFWDRATDLHWVGPRAGRP